MEVINPSAPSQAGLFSVVELSNGQPLSSQSLLEANASGLVPGASYFYRVRATNSMGDYWAGSTSSFVAAHPLEFNATHGPLYFSEKQPIGSIVGNFEAMDANATLTYAFSEGFPKKVFELNGTYLAGEIVEANGSLLESENLARAERCFRLQFNLYLRHGRPGIGRKRQLL